MATPDDTTSNLTLRAIPARVRATLAARARARHQSLNAYLIEVLTREADTPTMAEVLADIEAIRRPTGLTGDDAVTAVRESRETRGSI
jgi:hypothetical protein